MANATQEITKQIALYLDLANHGLLQFERSTPVAAHYVNLGNHLDASLPLGDQSQSDAHHVFEIHGGSRTREYFRNVTQDGTIARQIANSFCEGRSQDARGGMPGAWEAVLIAILDGQVPALRDIWEGLRQIKASDIRTYVLTDPQATYDRLVAGESAESVLANPSIREKTQEDLNREQETRDEENRRETARVNGLRRALRKYEQHGHGDSPQAQHLREQIAVAE